MTVFASGRGAVCRPKQVIGTPGGRPAFVDQGAVLKSADIVTGPFQPVWPATVNAGDLGLLVAAIQNTPGGLNFALTAAAVSEGWVEIGKVISSAGTLGLLVAAKIADGDEDGAAMVGGYDRSSGTNTGDATMARILRFTAANGFATTPYEAVGTGEFSGTTYNAPTIVPGGANRLAVAVAVAQLSDAAGFDAFAGASGGTWAEISDFSDALGPAQNIQVQTADIDSTISGGSDAVNDLTYLTVKFALVPAPV